MSAGIPFMTWRRYVALQESRALRAFVRAGRWPVVSGTDFRG